MSKNHYINKKTPVIVLITGVCQSSIYFLLVECLSYVNGASYGATYHGVVTDAEEAHHLYVSRY
jgi:hypothetical protein